MYLFKEQLPELNIHFRSQSFHTSMYASSWFLTLFLTFLPLPVATRIFDIFMYEVGKNAFFFLNKAFFLKKYFSCRCFSIHIIKPALSGPRDYLSRWLGHSTVQPNWPRSAGHGGHVPGSLFQDLLCCYHLHVQTCSFTQKQKGKFTETSAEKQARTRKVKTAENMEVFTDSKISELNLFLNERLGVLPKRPDLVFPFCLPAFPEGDSSPVWQLPWQADPQGLPDQIQPQEDEEVRALLP